MNEASLSVTSSSPQPDEPNQVEDLYYEVTGHGGLMTAEHMRRLAVQGKITPETLVRCAGQQWQPAHAIMDAIAPPTANPQRPARLPVVKKPTFFMDEHPWVGLLLVVLMLTTFFILAQCRGSAPL